MNAGSQDVRVLNQNEGDLLLQNLLVKLETVTRSQAPDWWAVFDDTDTASAGRREVMDLLETAPNDLARFYILGQLTVQVAIQSHIGGPIVEDRDGHEEGETE